jgi:hypothetical protein
LSVPYVAEFRAKVFYDPMTETLRDNRKSVLFYTLHMTQHAFSLSQGSGWVIDRIKISVIVGIAVQGMLSTHATNVADEILFADGTAAWSGAAKRFGSRVFQESEGFEPGLSDHKLLGWLGVPTT